MIVWQLSSWIVCRAKAIQRWREIDSYGLTDPKIARRKYQTNYAYCVIRMPTDGEDIPDGFKLAVNVCDIITMIKLEPAIEIKTIEVSLPLPR